MQYLMTTWNQLPAEWRGAILLWCAGMALAVMRAAANRYLPPSTARVVIERLDGLLDFVLANSRPLKARVLPERKKP